MTRGISRSHAKKSVSRTSEKTRQAVIDAAVNCLAAEGYHRATSNRIAREAGLTWGVIQYHFGGREGIYRAVLDSIIDAYVIELDQLVGSSKDRSISERLSLLVESVWPLLNEPAYIATMELLSNLGRDPESGLDTQIYVRRWVDRLGVLWQELFPEYTENSPSSTSGRQIFFAALRGFVDNRLIGLSLPTHNQAVLNEALVVACGMLMRADLKN